MPIGIKPVVIDYSNIDYRPKPCPAVTPNRKCCCLKHTAYTPYERLIRAAKWIVSCMTAEVASSKKLMWRECMSVRGVDECMVHSICMIWEAVILYDSYTKTAQKHARGLLGRSKTGAQCPSNSFPSLKW